MLRPTHAILKNGLSLYRDGFPYQFAESVGPWSHARYMDDGHEYTAGPRAPVVGPSAPMGLLQIPLSLCVNGVVTPFVSSKPGFYAAGNAELHVTEYPQALRIRARLRIKPTDKIGYAAIRIGGVDGAGSQFNLERDGEWNGRTSAKLPSGQRLHAFVVDAREKYPRGYQFRADNLDLILHTNLREQDVSKQGAQTDLNAYLTGTLSTQLPPEYVDLLTNDADVKRAAVEIPVAAQVSNASIAEFYISLEFWLAHEPVEPQAPLVLLDGYESAEWSKVKPGASDDDLAITEERLLALAEHKLATGYRGSICYGDFAHNPGDLYRRNMNNHYFQVELAWRSFLRTGDPRWYKLAKAFSNYWRDKFLDGTAPHGKGLCPWSAPLHSQSGHWVSPDMYAYIVDGDYLWQRECDAYAARFTLPSQSNREAAVPMHNCRILAWLRPAEAAKWKGYADTIDQKIRAAVAAGQTSGVTWHPLAFDKPLGLSDPLPDGILNVLDLVATQRLDEFDSLILYGLLDKHGQEIGFGPMGENYVGLQLERIYDATRGRRLDWRRAVVYPSRKDQKVIVFVEKSDDFQSTLKIQVASRKGGDIPPVLVTVRSPDGKETTYFDWRKDTSVQFPKYPLAADVKGFVRGQPCAHTTLPLDGKAGRYTVCIFGQEWILAYGPLSSYVEWADAIGEFAWLGQDETGHWPAGNVLVGSSTK